MNNHERCEEASEKAAAAESDRRTIAALDAEGSKSPPLNEEFSWYGGQVDREIVREIVRLKREHNR